MKDNSLRLIGLMVVALNVGADEIHLRDGQVLEGDIVSQSGAAILEVRVSIAGMVAVRHIPREQVLSVSAGPSSAQKRMMTLLNRREQLMAHGTAEEWRKLADGVRSEGDLIMWRSCMIEVVNRDRRDASARRTLGFALHRGVWMKVNEIQLVTGQVYFRDQWMSWVKKEQILAEDAVRQADEQREAEGRQRAAVLAAAAVQGGGIYPSIEQTADYRVVYWPVTNISNGGYLTGSNNHNRVFSVNARGGNDRLRWNFHWNF